MTNKIALKGGTDWADGDVLFAADLVDTFNSFYTKVYSDNTGGSITSSSTETDLATITVLTADFNSGSTAVVFDINTSFDSETTTSNATLTYRLYVDGSVVKTVVMRNSASNIAQEAVGSFTHVATANDVAAGNIIVKVTGQNSTANAGEKSEVTGLKVTAINDNT